MRWRFTTQEATRPAGPPNAAKLKKHSVCAVARTGQMRCTGSRKYKAFKRVGEIEEPALGVDTPSTVSSALHGAQAGLKELAQVTLKIGSKLREIEK